MPLDLDAVGRSAEAREVTWTSKDALLYALGVGAGQDDPLRELEFTTENSQGVVQRVLPTFGVLLTQRATAWPDLGEFDRAMLVHAEQALTLHRPLPPQGRATVTSRVSGIYDKGSGALVVIEASATDLGIGEPLLSTSSGAFIRGEGGFGGPRGTSVPWERPERPPDVRVSAGTRPDQALLYRLSGDRNPLHSDPAFAARAGFPRPILHGLCTFGYTGRLLLHALCASDPARFRRLRGRFSRPVLPGVRLTVSAWVDGDTARFQTTDEGGTVVIDQGLVSVGAASG